MAEEKLKLKDVVTVFRSGGGEVITIPAKVRQELNIGNGDRLALYVNEDTGEILLRKLP